jgi:hypothetical protein
MDWSKIPSTHLDSNYPQKKKKNLDSNHSIKKQQNLRKNSKVSHELLAPRKTMQKMAL